MKNKNHVITSHNVEQEGQKSVQSDVVIPNKLSNGDTCQGLRHWRLLFNLKNNFSKPVRNDMDNKILKQLTATPTHTDSLVSPQLNGSLCKVQDDVTSPLALGGRGVVRGGNSLQNDATTCPPLEGGPKSLISRRGKNVLNCNQEPSPEFVSNVELSYKRSDKNRLDCFASARNDVSRHTEDGSPKYLQTLGNRFFAYAQNDAKDKNGNELINLSTYRLIDFKKKIAFTLAEGATHVDLPPTKAKLAFTLAEVLITLGIIGIVAAMTIPSMISNFQKREIETRLKEDYSIFSQVNKMMIENDVAFNMTAIDNDTQKLRDWLDKYAFPYMKVARICNDPTIGCWSGSATYLNGRSFGDCKAGGCGSAWVSFVMNNGTKVATDIGNNEQLKGQMGVDSEADSCLKMYVDVNGDKKPNKFGVDIFLMTFTEDGFMPAGYTKTPEELAKNCSPTNYGTWCMTHVKNSNWTIPDDVWKSRNKK